MSVAKPTIEFGQQEEGEKQRPEVLRLPQVCCGTLARSLQCDVKVFYTLIWG